MLSQVIPVTPAIDQFAVPVGVAPRVGPESVVVKVKTDPREAVGELVVMDIVGVNFEIAMTYGVLGPEAK